MNRRGFFKRAAKLAAGAAAIVGAGMVPKVAEASADPIQAKIDAVLANPEKHPEIMARAQQMMGVSSGIEIDSIRDIKVVGNTISGVTHISTPHRDDWPVPPTFEAMAQDCESRGCRLVKIFEVDRSAFVFSHDAEPWRPMHERQWITHAEDGQRYVDRTPEALARIQAWRTSLHERAV